MGSLGRKTFFALDFAQRNLRGSGRFLAILAKKMGRACAKAPLHPIFIT
jgi:hypothetical protein